MAFIPIDYKLKTADAQLSIPMGKSETYPVDKPLPVEETASFVNVSLKVYTEPSLSKAKAANPERYALNEAGDVISHIHGYFYLFVNNHLWREIVALKDGMLAEVDLVKYYGENERRDCSFPLTGCVTPKKTIALNCEGEALKNAQVRIAFSPVQWSWQYIMALGGLYKNDPRQNLVPKPDYCQDLVAAKRLQAKRCQLVDMDEAEAEKVIYVQDPLGIAFDLMNKCQFNYLAIQEENTKLTKKKHFDSGVLAYQSMFGDELHEKKQEDYLYFPRLNSEQLEVAQRSVYKDRSDAAKFLRSGAKNIDKNYLEDYLSSSELESHLQELPKNQLQLFNFIADKPNGSSNPPDDYIRVEHAVKDLATLEGLDYLIGFKWMADMFNIMVMDADSVGTFRPWNAKLPAEQTRLANERGAKASAKAFLDKVFGEKHWITDYFTPKLDLYDLTIPGHAPTVPPEANDGSGLFRYDTFNQIHQQLQKEKQDNEHLLANKTLKAFLGAGSQVVGYVTGAWGRISNQYSTGELKAQYIKIRDIMVATNKATGVAEFSDIHIKNAGAVIGDDAAVVGITNYKRVQVNRAARRARVKHFTKNPPANAVTITDAKGNVIASHSPKNFGANKGAMADANWVDYNKLMGNYDLLEGEMVVVPKAHRYAQYYNDPNFQLGNTDTIKLNGLKILEKGLPQVMLAFEVFNGTQLVAKFKAGEKVDPKFGLEVINAVFAMAAGSFEVARIFSTRTERLAQTRLMRGIGWKLGKVIGGIGVSFGVLLSLTDATIAAKSHDMDAAFLHASAAVISVVGFLYLGAALVTTPLGWAVIALGLIITLLAIAFTDNSIEKWAINGPFSRKVSARCTGYYKKWDEYPIECYSALRNELFAPSMALSIEKWGSNGAFLKAEVVAPGFVVGQSELVMVVNQITSEGFFSFDKESRLSYNNWRITQHLNTDNLEANPKAAEFIAEPQITGFTYLIPIKPAVNWDKGLDVEWQVKLQYALDTKTTLPYVDKEEREAWDKDEIPDKAWLIKEVEYER